MPRRGSCSVISRRADAGAGGLWAAAGARASGPIERPRSSNTSAIRVPGNRFIHYLPYFQQARIQVERGDYDQAAHNLDVSEAFGAVRFDRRRLAEFQSLRLVTQVKSPHQVQSPDPGAIFAVQN